MTETAKDAYDALLTTLSEENYKEYNKRNHEYYSDTLNLFNKAGETDSVHHLWRHKYMIQEMISILTSHERTQNWWKYEEFDSYPDPELDLEQYINSEVYPSIARKDLELMAAQEYIKETKGILIPLPNHTQEAIVTPEDNKTSNYQLENKLKTEGEEINFSQLVKKQIT
jgi:L-rhamnose mutarotase